MDCGLLDFKKLISKRIIYSKDLNIESCSNLIINTSVITVPGKNKKAQ